MEKIPERVGCSVATLSFWVGSFMKFCQFVLSLIFFLKDSFCSDPAVPVMRSISKINPEIQLNVDFDVGLQDHLLDTMFWSGIGGADACS